MFNLTAKNATTEKLHLLTAPPILEAVGPPTGKSALKAPLRKTALLSFPTALISVKSCCFSMCDQLKCCLEKDPIFFSA